jgi:two-component system, cell cycle sensor histidine kinase and response regulator CckA
MTQCILLVDDEPTILQLVKSILETESFVVLTAKDGPEALSVLEARVVDALLTDLRMPAMSGHELLREARRRYPHLPVCCMTGYVEEPGIKDVALIRKPFRADELLNTVRQLLARAKAQASGQS